MNSGLIIQYSICGIILAAAFIWVIWKAIKRKSSGNDSSCCGCSLSNACNKKKNDSSEEDCRK